MEMVTDYELLMSFQAGDFDAETNAMVDMPWIEPYEPQSSFLQHKLDGTFEELGTNGGQIMWLFEGEAEIVRQWIADGANP